MLLRKVLDNKGLKQKWLADKIGVTVVTVSKWCTGKSKPQKNHLRKIASILNVKPESLTFR